ncbi:MAG TPA: hypothetical protein VGR63_02800 [Casimicrobiaceae bacterium]|nr:hypothetical protein [Casimicrobiaceae bacterium]
MTFAPSSDPALRESRWPPAIALVLVIAMLRMLPGHVVFLPIWTSYVCLLAVLVAMAAAALTRRLPWLRVEHALIMLLGGIYVVNTGAELADMVGAIALHPQGGNAYSLLSSAVGIWIANVVVFSMLYWQIDGGGPYGRAQGVRRSPDWDFPRPGADVAGAGAGIPKYLDYLFLAYTTATAFSPTDASPYTRRAKMLMMLESMISLVTLIFVLARAINVLPG